MLALAWIAFLLEIVFLMGAALGTFSLTAGFLLWDGDRSCEFQGLNVDLVTVTVLAWIGTAVCHYLSLAK